jgi:hypothetical protein
METLKAASEGAVAGGRSRAAAPDAVVTHIKIVLGKAAPIQRGDIKGLKDLILSGGGIGPSSASDKAKEALETFSIADDGSLVDQNRKKILSGTDCEAIIIQALTDVEDFRRLLFAAPSGGAEKASKRVYEQVSRE